MSFDSFSDFLAMGRHGAYVWSCYLITLIVVLWNLWAPRAAMKKEIESLQAQWRREENDASDS